MAARARLCAPGSRSDGRGGHRKVRGHSCFHFVLFVLFCGNLLLQKEAIMETDFTNISGMFKANTDIVSKAIAAVEPEHWFKKPGDDSNHLTWMLGHLIVHRGHTLKALGVDYDNTWAELFARGSERTAD